MIQILDANVRGFLLHSLSMNTLFLKQFLVEQLNIIDQGILLSLMAAISIKFPETTNNSDESNPVEPPPEYGF